MIYITRLSDIGILDDCRLERLLVFVQCDKGMFAFYGGDGVSNNLLACRDVKEVAEILQSRRSYPCDLKFFHGFIK